MRLQSYDDVKEYNRVNKNEGKKGGRGGRQLKERAVRWRKKREVMNNDEQHVTIGIG